MIPRQRCAVSFAPPWFRALTILGMGLAGPVVAACSPASPPAAGTPEALPASQPSPSAAATTATADASRATLASPPPEPTASASAVASGPPPLPPLALCLASLGELPSRGEACDSGFHVRRQSCCIDCGPGDFPCLMQMVADRPTPLGDRPEREQIADCVAECQAGQGASCARMSLAFLGKPSPEDRGCRALFEHLACENGMSKSCEQPGAPAGEISARESAKRLEEACHPGEASWACFYQADARRTGAMGNLDAYRPVCNGRCPKAPARCFRQMACEALHAKMH